MKEAGCGYKMLAFVLAAMLGIGTAAGCVGNGDNENAANILAEEREETEEQGSLPASGEYSEHLEFTVLSLDYPDGFDTMPLIQEAKEKFNVDFKVQQITWDNWDETIRTMAAERSFPEVIAWFDVIYGEYKNYAEQGILKPLPDDLSRWPNLQNVAEDMPVFEKLRMEDGKMYCFPKLNPNQPFNHHNNEQFIYRRDWAKAMGYDFAPCQELTYSEFVAYLRDLKKKDPGGLGDKLVPLDFYSGGLTWSQFAGLWNKNMTNYYEKDGQYYWGGRDAESLEGIKQLKALYDEGLIYREGYADVTSAGTERFQAGRSGVWFGDFSLSVLIEEFADGLASVDPDFSDEDLGTFVIRMPDGKFHSREYSNWWASFAFSSECSDAVMNRFLDIGNWLLEKEQMEKYAYGVYGKDWTKDENGQIQLNYIAADTIEGAERNYIIQQRYFQKWIILEGQDKWLEENPARRDYLQDEVFKAYYEFLDEAEKRGEVKFYPFDYNISFFSGPYFDRYGIFSSEIQNAVIDAVVSDNAEETWNWFLEDKEDEVDAVLEELNGNLR